MRKQFLNYDWLFKENFEENDLTLNNFSNFIKVNIPHTNKEVPLNNFDSTISNIVSIYKKIINIESLEYDNILVFEGVGHRTYVYVNGKLVYTHYCGYTQFKVNLNKNGHVGNNEIALVVDSNEIDQPPFGFVIDYLCFGGIYRDVYLDVLNKCHINNYYFHHDSEKLYIDYELSNDDDVIIEAIIKDSNSLFKLSCNNKEVLSCRIPDVILWDIDNPHLYDLSLRVIKNNNIIDEINDRIGFRYIDFKENGFYLNNKLVKIRGLNRHQSYPYVGYAMPRSIQYEDAEILKNELCVNGVRTSHYPDSPDFLRACDELGLLVFEEIPGWQHIGDKDWQDKAINNVRDMILRDRNHPSIILWGVRINESGDNHDFYTKTNDLAHKLDKYRLTGGVRCQMNSELLEDVYTYNDFVCTNKGISLRRKEEVTDSLKPYLVSEYGGHMMPTKSYDRETRRTDVALLHANVLKAASNDDRILGTFGWCFSDYNTHMDFGSGDLICHHGVMDIFRNPKYSSYPYKTMSKNPYLEITSNFNIGEHDGGYIRYFAIMTNCDKVEMYHNDLLVSTYDNLRGDFNGCFRVDDILGDTLIKLENKSLEESNYLKEIIKLLLKYDGIVRDEIKEKYRIEDINQAWQYYGKYVSNWGSHPTPFLFKGYINNKMVIERVKGYQYIDYIDVRASSDTLHTKNSYDVFRLTLEAIGTLGNRVDYAFDSFVIETSDELEVIGDKVVSLIAGIRSIYIKSKAKSGTGKVTIKSSRFKDIELLINIVED